LDCLSPEALDRAADLAMEYLDKQQSVAAPTPPAISAAQADIDARESDVREQFKAGKLPPGVFKSWLAEFAREREALNRRTTPKPARITRADFLQEYKSAVTRKLKVFTARENIAQSREALRTVLAEGRLILRPDAANARFEGSLVLSHEEFFEQKQIDIKLVAGARFGAVQGMSCVSQTPSSCSGTPAGPAVVSLLPAAMGMRSRARICSSTLEMRSGGAAGSAAGSARRTFGDDVKRLPKFRSMCEA
jgi:hypothetical protein